MIAFSLPPALIRRPRLAILAAAIFLSVLAAITGMAATADRLIDPWRFAAADRPASGAVVIVELDAESLAAIRRWPWSREHHARLTRQLTRAGAASIVYDVDFSAASDQAGDAAFARALAASGGRVALPTFGQQARSGDARSLDSLPLPIFRPHATLASVNIAPDPDGVVRRAPLGTMTDGQPRPSLPAFIAGRSGTADTFYPIDFAIDPQTISRLSFVAVEQGRFDPAAVRGRHVLIGATAIELGDRFSTPRWGVIPGVVIQALGAETLFRGVPVEWGELWPLIAALLLSIAIVRARSLTAGIAATLVAVAALVGGAMLLQGEQIYVPVAAALILIAAAVAGRAGLSILRRFARQQLTDAASGLPNRRALIAAEPAAAVQMAVLRVTDYDSLSAILGDAADRDLPRRIADRLAHASRDAKVWRIADRLLAFHLPAEVEADDVLAGLRAIMLQPIEVNGHRVDVAVTVGVADGSGDGAVTEAALAAAQAQAEGVFWRRGATDVDALEQQMSMMGELDEAIAQGQIEVHYQPKLSIATDVIASCEALVRWRHPTRGMIRPDLFIPLAEHSDRIAPLTLHVIDLAMRDLAAWRAAGHRLTVAVNISATLLSSPSFDASVRALITAGPVPAETLVFEVTESATIADPQAAAATLEGYRALGIAISMDDYGTGQSTLSYLRRLPLSELKIDRSFVQHAHRNRADAVLVRSTIDLAHELGLKVVAEGVEDAECLALLRDLGCDMVQGYLISRPVPAPDFAALLAGPRAEAA